jgi:uncharacterized membrane protein
MLYLFTWLQINLFRNKDVQYKYLTEGDFSDKFSASDLNISTYSNVEFFMYRVINFVLWFLGLIMLAVIIYAGYTMMTSAGNDEALTKGRKILVGSIAGFVVVLLSYAAIISILYASDFLAPRALELIP